MQLAFQKVNIQQNDIEDTEEILESLGYEPNWFIIPPFTDLLISEKPFEEPTALFGGTKLMKMNNSSLPSNHAKIFHDRERFDQKFYKHYIEKYLLNGDADFATWGEVKNQMFDRPVFIKPSSDVKYFPGFLYEIGAVVECQLYNEHIVDSDLSDHTSVLVNPNLYKVDAEYRAFVVNHKLIDITQSHKNGVLCPERIDNTVLKEELIKFIDKVRELYEPHRHYVIDISRTWNHLKVVEFNCINCAGKYAHDAKAIYQALLDYEQET